MNDSFLSICERLERRDDAAAARVFDEFTGRLCALARSRLDSRTQQKVDPEDVVQSVYRSFFRRRAEGDLEAEDWNDLWRLLAAIAVHKCRHTVRDFRRDKRDIRREEPLAIETGASTNVWEPEDRDPTPDEAAALIDTMEVFLGDLSERDRSIVGLRLQDHTEREIADQVRCSERTARRVLHFAKEELKEQLGDGDALRGN